MLPNKASSSDSVKPLPPHSADKQPREAITGTYLRRVATVTMLVLYDACGPKKLYSPMKLAHKCKLTF
jgi:hypothetical protein